MPKHLTVDVTQADIDQALVKNSSRCVVATAIARSIEGARRISVDVQSIRFSVGDERHVYLTPYNVAGYVVAFDAGDDIHPFRFQLRGDQQVKARQTKRTPAGATVDNARATARDKKKSADHAQAQLAGLLEQGKSGELPPPSPVQVKAARAKVEAKKADAETAAQERDAVVAAYAGHRRTEPEDTTKPKAPPMVFKRNERAYGMRKLRINAS